MSASDFLRLVIIIELAALAAHRIFLLVTTARTMRRQSKKADIIAGMIAFYVTDIIIFVLLLVYYVSAHPLAAFFGVNPHIIFRTIFIMLLVRLFSVGIWTQV